MRYRQTMATRRPKTWRDSNGKTLEDYPRPSVAVDTAVLTVTGGSDSAPPELCVVLTTGDDSQDKTPWALPGTFLHAGEQLADAVLRSLRDKAGIERLSPAQLQVFDDPGRDLRGWVLSVGHMDVVPERTLAPALASPKRVKLVPVANVIDGATPLPFDHDVIVREAVEQLRGEYAAAADARRLLPSPFTLRQLEDLHRAIDPETEAKDTFRRRVISDLQATGDLSSGSVGKPARLFVHR